MAVIEIGLVSEARPAQRHAELLVDAVFAAAAAVGRTKTMWWMRQMRVRMEMMVSRLICL